MKNFKLFILALVYSTVFIFQINHPTENVGLPILINFQKSTESLDTIQKTDRWKTLQYDKAIRKNTWVKVELDQNKVNVQPPSEEEILLSFYRRSVWEAVVYMPPEYKAEKVSIFTAQNQAVLNKYITIPMSKAALTGEPIYIQSKVGSISGFLKVSSKLELINYESTPSTLQDMVRGVNLVSFLLGVMLFWRLKDKLYAWFSIYVLAISLFTEVRFGSIFDTYFGEFLALYGANISGITISSVFIVGLIFFPLLSLSDIYAQKLEKSRKSIIGLLLILLALRLMGVDLYGNILLYCNLLYLVAIIQIIASCSLAAYNRSHYAQHALWGLSFLAPVVTFQILGALNLTVENDYEYLYWSISFAMVTLFFMLSLTHKALSFKLERDSALNMALIDRLTGIKNRRAMNNDFAVIKKEIQSGISTYYFVMLDIDHFKNINDTWGHMNGDICLKKMTASVQEVLREDDLFYRYGGEEFLLILNSSEKDTVHEICERIRAKVESLEVAVDGNLLQFTVSLGVAQATADSDLKDCMQRADTALYNSKRTGRNRVSFSQAMTI